MKIFLIITTCIHRKSHSPPAATAEHRKNLYLESIQKTLKLLPKGIEVSVVENSGLKESYLDALPLPHPVIYTNNNQIDGGKVGAGVNELADIHEVIRQREIGDDDIVIKLTGRYHPTDDSFFQKVLEGQQSKQPLQTTETQGSFAAWVKFMNVCTGQYERFDCVLGLIAMRGRLWKDFSYFPYSHQSPEVQIATFIRSKVPQSQLVEFERLGLRCCFADNLRILDV